MKDLRRQHAESAKTEHPGDLLAAQRDRTARHQEIDVHSGKPGPALSD